MVKTNQATIIVDFHKTQINKQFIQLVKTVIKNQKANQIFQVLQKISQ